MSPVRTIHVDRTSFFLLSVSSPFPPQQLFIHFLSPDFKSEDILLPLALPSYSASLRIGGRCRDHWAKNWKFRTPLAFSPLPPFLYWNRSCKIRGVCAARPSSSHRMTKCTILCEIFSNGGNIQNIDHLNSGMGNELPLHHSSLRQIDMGISESNPQRRHQGRAPITL